MRKIVVDTSVIDSTFRSFLEYAKGNTMVLANLTFDELQDREKDPYCTQMGKVFAKRIIRYFAEPFIHEVDYKTEIVELEKESSHVDHSLVMWAKTNKATVYTGDYGMVLDCGFNKVPIIWAEHSTIVELAYIEKKDENFQLDLTRVGFGISVFVLDKNLQLVRSDEQNRINLIDEDQILEFAPGDTGEPILSIYNVRTKTSEIIKVEEKKEIQLSALEQKYLIKWKRFKTSKK